MQNLSAIDEWRRTLTMTERLALNHPTAVWRKWKAFIEPEKPKSDKPTLHDSVISLEEENFRLKDEAARLKAHIAELEAARDVAAPAEAPMWTPAGKNPLMELNAGQIVDLILELKASTRKAIVHDLVKEETEKKPSQSDDETPPPAKPRKKAKAAKPTTSAEAASATFNAIVESL